MSNILSSNFSVLVDNLSLTEIFYSDRVILLHEARQNKAFIVFRIVIYPVTFRAKY